MSLVYQNQTARELYYGSQRIRRAYAGSQKIFDSTRGKLWKNCFDAYYKYILNGRLYAADGTQIPVYEDGGFVFHDDWIDIGLRDGGLLYSVGTYARREGNDTGWTAIRENVAMRDGKLFDTRTMSQIGGNFSDFSELYNEGFALRNGQVCYAQDGIAVPDLPSGDWHMPNGSFSPFGGDAFAGILNGNLYIITRSTATLIDSSGWTVTGDSLGLAESTPATIGIKNGNLYAIRFANSGAVTIEIIDSNQGWEAVSGQYNYACCAFALRNGSLYAVNSQLGNIPVLSRIGTDSDWTDICGYYNSPDFSAGLRFAYAVKSDRTLYKLTYNSATLIG